MTESMRCGADEGHFWYPVKRETAKYMYIVVYFLASRVVFLARRLIGCVHGHESILGGNCATCLQCI